MKKPRSRTAIPDRVAGLVTRLRKTERELQDLTGGQLDAVVGAEGGAYLLREAQERLRLSEAAQRQAAETQTAILDSLPANVALIDPSGIILAVNESWRSFGRSNGLQGQDYGIGQNYLELCELASGDSQEDGRAAALGIREVLAGRSQNFAMEYSCHSPETKRWFRLIAAPLRGTGRGGAVVTHVDITGRKLAEEAQRESAEVLRASEERFRLLSKATNDAVWDWDIENDAIWWNEGFQVLFGFSTDECATAQAWADRIHPDDREWVVPDLHQAIQTGQTAWVAEYRFERKNGSFAWVLDRGHLMRDSNGRVVRMVGGMTDLTERRRADERVADQAALLDAAREAIYVTDLNDRVIYWNKGAARTYGWTQDEALGRASSELLGKDSARVAEGYSALLNTGEWSGDLVKRAKDGRELQVEVRRTLVRDDQGAPKSILAINSDVTEKKRFEAHLLRAQRMESIGTLAGGIAHDLNNVLAPILMSVAMLRDSITDADGRELLDTLQATAQRGAELVKQVLSFARGLEGKRVPINPAHLARDIEKIIRDTFPKNIECSLQSASDLWSVLGDPTQLHQVLMNLVVNARDAMPDGGRLTIQLENVTLDDVYAGLHPDAKPGAYVRIIVADTGRGIEPAILEKIFEPFFTTKEVGNGTGLGLSTAHAILQGHGGFIHVSSEPGKGARFKVYLPVAASGDALLRTDLSHTPLPRGHGELVLVVDDEAAVRAVAQKTLERYGYQVLLAANGAEAIACYAQRRKDVAVVLTDMAMPVMDGPATILALRTVNPAVKIIGSSGLTSSGALAKLPGVELQHFVHKPYTAETLLNVLEQALRGTRRSD